MAAHIQNGEMEVAWSFCSLASGQSIYLSIDSLMYAFPDLFQGIGNFVTAGVDRELMHPHEIDAKICRSLREVNYK